MIQFVLALLFSPSLSYARNLDTLYEKVQVKVGSQLISVYVADNDQRRSQGLMFVEKLLSNTGMLFVFPSEEIQGFWMKNTLIPLSIGFFNAKGELVDSQEMQIAKSLLSNEVPSYQSRAPAVFALEMPAGWFAKNNIKMGARLSLVSKSRSTILNQKFKTPRP